MVSTGVIGAQTTVGPWLPSAVSGASTGVESGGPSLLQRATRSLGGRNSWRQHDIQAILQVGAPKCLGYDMTSEKFKSRALNGPWPAKAWSCHEWCRDFLKSLFSYPSFRMKCHVRALTNHDSVLDSSFLAIPITLE